MYASASLRGAFPVSVAAAGFSASLGGADWAQSPAGIASRRQAVHAGYEPLGQRRLSLERESQRRISHASSASRKLASLLALGPRNLHCEELHCEELSKSTLLAKLRAENEELREKVRLLESKGAPSAPIYRIVVTGGPCAGKTTALSSLKARLEKAGWRVFMVPEAATTLFHNGARYHDFLKHGDGGVVNFQTQLANLQMRLEATMFDMARATEEKSVLLCDRGVMDGKAYCSPQAWPLVIDGLGQTEVELRDRRYDAIIHMVTAACGAEDSYTLSQAEGGETFGKTTARTETVEEAKALDDKTIQCWIGHEHLYFIDNSTSFEHKLDRVADRVLKVIGEGVAGHCLRKFRLPWMSSEEIAAAAHEASVPICTFRCSTTYVSQTARVRLRSNMDSHGNSFHLQTFRRNKAGRLRRVGEQIIDGREYMRYLREAHKEGNRTVEKELVCFHWGGVVYEVNIFRWPEEVCILEVEAESIDSHISIPPLLKGRGRDPVGSGCYVEVTEDAAYETRTVAGSGRVGQEFGE